MKVTIFNHKIDGASMPGRDNDLFIPKEIFLYVRLVYVLHPTGKYYCFQHDYCRIGKKRPQIPIGDLDFHIV